MAREQGYRNTTFITPWSSLSSYVEARRPGYDTNHYCVLHESQSGNTTEQQATHTPFEYVEV